MAHWMKRAAMTCSALVLMSACTKSDGADETKRGHRLPPGETHLTFTLPEVRPSGSFKGRPAITFRIPREYVWLEGVLSRRDGASWQVYQVPVEIEYPKLTPRQNRSIPRRGASAADEFATQPPQEWYLVKVGSGSGLGGRGYFLNSISPGNVQRRTDMIADGEAYGLVRYSPLRCFTPENLKNPQLRAFLDAKPADDPMPETNCRVARDSSEYFSPLSTMDSESVVSISCLQNTCNTSFDFEDVGATITIPGNQLARWSEIVNPIRDLLRSFIVREISNSRSQPPSAASSPR
jgi:hypothetical protein